MSELDDVLKRLLEKKLAEKEQAEQKRVQELSNADIDFLEVKKANLNDEVNKLELRKYELQSMLDRMEPEFQEAFSKRMNKIESLNERIEELSEKVEKYKEMFRVYKDFESNFTILENKKKSLIIELDKLKEVKEHYKSATETKHRLLTEIREVLEQIRPYKELKHDTYEKLKELQELVVFCAEKLSNPETYIMVKKMFNRVKPKPVVSDDTFHPTVKKLYQKVKGETIDDSIIEELNLVDKLKDIEKYLKSLRKDIYEDKI